MIISRWRGFEIDSSEGYYFFQQDLDNAEEGWDFLRTLLSSPLLWKKVSFTLIPAEPHKKRVETFLKGKLDLALIEKHSPGDEKSLEEEKEQYDYYACEEPEWLSSSHISPEFTAPVAVLLEIFDDLKTFLDLISVNFSIAPLKSLPENEYVKFRSWFMEQYKNKKKANRSWKLYCKVKEKDLCLAGNCEQTGDWDPVDGFEANFEFCRSEYASYRFNLPSVDPSLLVYLLSELLDRFELVQAGRRSLDNAPDKLKLFKGEPCEMDDFSSSEEGTGEEWG